MRFVRVVSFILREDLTPIQLVNDHNKCSPLGGKGDDINVESQSTRDGMNKRSLARAGHAVQKVSCWPNDELVSLHSQCLKRYIDCSLQFKRVYRIPDSVIDCVPFEFDSLPDYLKSASDQFTRTSALLGALSMAYEDPALNSFDHLLDQKLEQCTYCCCRFKLHLLSLTNI